MSSAEQWKLIPGWPDYEISDNGQVRRVSPWLCGSAHRSFRSGKNLSLDLSGPYPVVTLYQNGKRTRCLVHRLVAAAFLGPANGRHVNHKNGAKIDNRVENLEWVTPSENGLHAYKKGLSKAGEMHHAAKLTDWQVRVIRRLPRKDQRGIAAMFGTNQATVSEIQRGVTRRAA